MRRTLPYLVAMLFGALAASLAFAQLGGSGITWRTFLTGSQSRSDQPATWVLRNDAQFQRYWSQYHVGRAPAGVDWNKEMLIAVHLGQRNNGGTRFAVEKIERVQGTVVVRTVEIPPARGMMTPQVLIQPWAIVRLPPQAGNIRFESRVATATGLPGGVNIIDPGNRGGDCGCTCACCRARRARGERCDAGGSEQTQSGRGG